MKSLRALALVIVAITGLSWAGDDPNREARDKLWTAVRNGEAATIKELLDKGTDVNAKNEIGISALWIAAGKDNQEVIELLIKHGADVNARDLIWYQTPLSQAIGVNNLEIIKLLLRSGAKDVETGFLAAVGRGRATIMQAILDHTKIKQDVLDAGLLMAPKTNEKVTELLTKAGAVMPKAIATEEREALHPLTGTFESDNGGKLTIEVIDQGLVIKRGGGSGQLLKQNGPDSFSPLGFDFARVTFQRDDSKAKRVTYKQYTAETNFYRIEDKPIAKAPEKQPEIGQGEVTAQANWPSFRGPDATGVANGQHPPVSWNVEKGENLQWKTPIPGLGHSCPIIWGDRVFITTAISGDPDPKIKIGNYGAVDSVDDNTKHSWQVICLDRLTGKILWTRTAFEGVPKIKRHLKGSQANCTPVTDGRVVVACFGSEGMYCYDFAGKLLWKRDLSSIDSSFQIDREYEWGFGSSPTICDGLVILQFDLSKDSFIAAYRLEDGERVWSTPRDEIPSWSSPTVWRNGKRTEIVTNAAQYARGYDPATGEELWRLAKKSEVTVPTPVIGKDLVYITSGNRPIQPIFGIRAGAIGDISLKPDEDHNAHIAWSKMRGGPYMPTPILYGNLFYTCGNAGMITCYEADSGKEVYRERLGGTSYTASPIAADGRLYFVSEEGAVRVVKAGPKFELLAVNELGDYCMATPAISAGTLFVRSQHYLFAFGRATDKTDKP